MFNSTILMENAQTTFDNNKPLEEMTTRESKGYLYDLLEFNDQMHDLDVSMKCDYYRALTESIRNGENELVLSEGVISNIKDKIVEIINKIINFIKNFISTITNKHQKTSKNFEEEKKRTKGFNFEFDQKEFDDWFNEFWNAYFGENPDADRETTYNRYETGARSRAETFDENKYMFLIFKYPDPQSIDDQAPRAAIRDLTTMLTDICNGKDIVADEASMAVAFKAMARVIKGSRSDFKGSVNSPDAFRQYIKTNVCYTTKEQMVYKDWRRMINSVPSYLGSDFVAKKTNGMVADLNKCKENVARSKENITPEQLKNANIMLGYIKKIVESWTWYINFVIDFHDRQLKDAKVTYDRIVKKTYQGPVTESASIHGEPFNGDTLFDNEDMKDFNPTEWLDLTLTTECYNIKFTIMEAYRRIALQEAIILSDENGNKVARINAMREATGNKVGSAIQGIIQRIKELISTFLAKVKDKFGENSNYIKRNMEALKNPINSDMTCSSKGDIIAGMYRVQDAINFVPFNYNTMKADFDSKEAFFEKHVMPSLNRSSQYSKRNVKWQEGMSITDFCKAYFGASMPEDKFDPCTYNGRDFETNKDNILKFLQQSNYLHSSIKADMSKIESEARKSAAAAAGANNANNTANGANTPGNDTANHESCFSILYNTVLTEADVDMGEEAKKNDGQPEGASDEGSAMRIYVDVYKDVILSKLTAAEFIVSELMQVMRKHAETHNKNAK